MGIEPANFGSIPTMVKQNFQLSKTFLSTFNTTKHYIEVKVELIHVFGIFSEIHSKLSRHYVTFQNSKIVNL